VNWRGDAGAQIAASVSNGLRDVPDFPTPGVVFKDISPLLSDGATLAQCTSALAQQAEFAGAELVAGIEARGFLVAAGIAGRLSLGVIPVRKVGKLPPPTRRLNYQLEYGQAEIELPSLPLEGKRVYLADDVLATGGSVEAAAQLLTEAGALVVGVGLLVELEFLGGRQRLAQHEVFSLLRL